MIDPRQAPQLTHSCTAKRDQPSSASFDFIQPESEVLNPEFDGKLTTPMFNHHQGKTTPNDLSAEYGTEMPKNNLLFNLVFQN